MYAPTGQIKASSRRGTVMVMVVGVLAMLFIIGSTLLIVGRFERQTVQISASARNLDAVSQGILEPVFVVLRAELVGSDDKAYNRGWLPVVPGDDYFPGADYGDYPGFIAANSPRNGDLLLSSVEPYKVPCCWDLFSASWFHDAIDPTSNILPPGTIAVGLVGSDADGGGIVEDADGDGIRDTIRLVNVGFSDSFGGSFSMGLRVIPHNAMVRLNRMTHPTLLAQVIHPTDLAAVGGVDTLRTAIANLDLGPTDENRLRRRFMLPPALPTPDGNQTYYDLASPLVQLLPITTGYARPNNPGGWVNNAQDHRQSVMFGQGDEVIWESLIQPTYAGGLTDPSYSAALDTYDRRRLITTESSDDALRPQRDEQRLQTYFPFTWNSLPVSFKDIISPVNASLPLAYGVMDYTASGGTVDHVFNTDGLRTQFSLRDVLEPNGQASYRRAMQLTAYFLAMIQHTTAANATPSAQLRTAMQLAVNAIDFADFDDPESDGFDNHIPTYFEFNGIKVVGVEKQPYITEAYAKVVRKPVLDGAGFKWPDSADPEYRSDESVYAVELYNPYATDLVLSDYDLVLVGGGSTIEVDLSSSGTITIPPYSYVVLANNDKDPSRTPGQTATEPLLSSGSPVVFSTIKMDAGQPVVLQRKAAKVYRLDSTNPWGPPVLGVSDAVDVDTIRPVGLGGADAGWAEGAAVPGGTPGANDRVVRDSSLQRHKEIAGQPPVHWHFTLSRQMLFPLPWCEDDEHPTPLTTDKDRLSQHNLLGTSIFTQNMVVGEAPTATLVSVTNQQIMALESAGLKISHDTQNGAINPSTPPAFFPLLSGLKDPIAPFPVLVADRGVHPNTGGTMAFPTTGTLLLVTRYAHLPQQTVDMITIPATPITVAATQVPEGIAGRQVLTFYPDNNPGQLQILDNGHMPAFYIPSLPSQPVDPSKVERCLDGNNSRFNDLPWGQLAFEYFTALPMEELARDLDLVTPDVQSLMDSPDYLNEYAAVGGAWNNPAMTRFLNYPVIMPVAQTLGPRVEGRIGIGTAPWWVLDGLPVLPDAQLGTVNTIPGGSYISLAGLPVPEIEAQRLDPAGTAWNSMMGAWFVHGLIDEKYFDLSSAPLPYSDPTYRKLPELPPAGMPSISPLLAKYMVSYREQREIENGAVPINAVYSDRIGFATTGELCNVVRKVRLGFDVQVGSNNLSKPSLDELRLAGNDPTNPTVRPYSYLGYLQLVAPIVRMQDWMTVKNHVFTIYATIQSSGQPPVTVRTQVTVDRTRCLYSSSDLPERITETPPISYYNAVDD